MTPFSDRSPPVQAMQATAPAWHVEYVLRLADSSLVLGQRIAEWCGHGPALEEEIAMANIGLDLIGQARLLLAHAGAIEGKSRDEDQLAYWRGSDEYRNFSLAELPNGEAAHDDYATTIIRNLLFAALMVPWWQALMTSSDAQLAAIAAKAINEARAHFRHARDWTVCFGDGTELSHVRALTALQRLWPYTHELFVDDAVDRSAHQAGVGVLPSSLYAAWSATIDSVLAEAGLTRPADSAFRSDGKNGRHTEHLDYLLAEMQSVTRAHPGASW
jgi:ring-1,2-phenylacetyl-CoA epoxidase subunit PaaC